MRYTINDLIYGGKYTDQFWNKSYNPNADIENGLANCTTFGSGACLVEGDPYPVSSIAPASRWDEVLINDWYSVPFDASKVKSGDIIEWKDKCHVAKVSDVRDGVIYVNASYYNGEHGEAYYHGTCILGALLIRLACPCIWKVGQSNAGVRTVILVSLGNVVVRSSPYLNA